MNEEKLYNIILSEQLTWEGLIRNIVKEEKMDPWDIDIVKLSERFSNEILKMKKINFRISGKFILAASILLRIKSDYLMIKEEEKEEDVGINLAWLFRQMDQDVNKVEIIPRIPILKKRRVSIDELIEALKKAIEVNERRIKRHEEKSRPIEYKIKKIDIKEKMADVYSLLTRFFKKLKKNEIPFEQLLPSKKRFDIIWTFIPLLYLTNEGKVDLIQKKTFGDIIVRKP